MSHDVDKSFLWLGSGGKAGCPLVDNTGGAIGVSSTLSVKCNKNAVHLKSKSNFNF